MQGMVVQFSQKFMSIQIQFTMLNLELNVTYGLWLLKNNEFHVSKVIRSPSKDFKNKYLWIIIFKLGKNKKIRYLWKYGPILASKKPLVQI